MYWMMWVPAPVRPWSTSGWKNWLSEAHVADMITTGSHSVFFSTSAIACVQNAPDVSMSSTSAPLAAIVVNWFVRSGAVGSCNCCSTTSMLVPSMAASKPST